MIPMQPQQYGYMDPMMMGGQINSTSNYNLGNDLQLNNPSFAQLRLDTRPMLRDIELFLSAKRVVLKEIDGKTIEEEMQIGRPLANQDGITALLNIVHLSANHHVVQGNLDDDRYIDLCYWTRIEITNQIVINCVEWGIEDQKLELVIDTLMRFYQTFLTRLLDNKERESYANTMVSKEITGMPQRRGGLRSLIGGV